jgi:hypothetical protein
MNIKKKTNTLYLKDKKNLETKLSKQLSNKKLMMEIHFRIHEFTEYYDSLYSKIKNNFNLGIGFFVISILGFIRTWKPLDTLIPEGIIIILMIIFGTIFVIDLVQLLKWNLDTE